MCVPQPAPVRFQSGSPLKYCYPFTFSIALIPLQKLQSPQPAQSFDTRSLLQTPRRERDQQRGERPGHLDIQTSSEGRSHV